MRIRIFTVSVLMAISCAGWAGDMYKWQDEDGIWHFSDRPPKESSQNFDTILTPNEPRRMITERRGGQKQEPEHWFHNDYHGPAELELRLQISENVLSDPPLPARIVLPGQKETRGVTIRSSDPRLGFRYQLAYSMVPGRPLSELPSNIDFFPPFPSGMEFPISQGFDGDATHKDAANQYAVDIVMPIGTPILAARAGVVMAVEDGFRGGEKKQKFLNRANRIRMLHDDGSMTVYAHLQARSARVTPGMRVPAGTWIGNSGNTGYSSGPHLHFVVQINAGLSLESLPFRFRQTAGTMTPEGRGVLKGVLTAP